MARSLDFQADFSSVCRYGLVRKGQGESASSRGKSSGEWIQLSWGMGAKRNGRMGMWGRKEAGKEDENGVIAAGEPEGFSFGWMDG